ncbi:MAG: hypothetical protein ACK4NS_00535 [Saprospiraceae bacterium]
MKKLIFSLIFVGACALYAQAQDYKSAIGLRLGYPASVSYKTFISDAGAIEAFVGFRRWSNYGWMNVAGLYQHHFPINDLDGLRWYVGGGASAFFWNYSNSFIGDNSTSTSFGILGVLGLDYKFANAPVNLSVDWIPVFSLNGFDSGFGGGYGALSARYTLN